MRRCSSLISLVLVVMLGACQPVEDAAGDLPVPLEAVEASPQAVDPWLPARPAPARSAAARPPAPPRSEAAAPPPAPAVLPATPRRLDGDRRLLTAPGSSTRWGSGSLRQFLVEVEGGLDVDPLAFAREVEAVLSDRRSWTSRYTLQRVDSGAVDLRVTLASPELTDQLCAPLQTGGQFSCWNDGRAVINARRWRDGAEAYGDDLPNYRRYVINHEVGHGLGYSHEQCPRAGEPAPVMVQQTKTVGACRPNPWPQPGSSP